MAQGLSILLPPLSPKHHLYWVLCYSKSRVVLKPPFAIQNQFYKATLLPLYFPHHTCVTIISKIHLLILAFYFSFKTMFKSTQKKMMSQNGSKPPIHPWTPSSSSIIMVAIQVTPLVPLKQ